MTNGEDRLREHVRRRMAELGIADYAALSARSGVKVRTINNMLAGRPSRARYPVEVALGWGVGSIDRILAGGEAIDAPPPVPAGTDRERMFLDVAEAIRQDAELLEEARQHLLRQYDMLVRLSRAERGEPSGAASREVRGRDLTGDEEAQLRAEERAQMEQRVLRRKTDRDTNRGNRPGSGDSVGGAG